MKPNGSIDHTAALPAGVPLALALVCCSWSALAAERLEVQPGVEARLERGVLTASRGGRVVWRGTLEGADPDGAAALEVHALAGGRAAVHASVSDERSAVEAVLFFDAGGDDVSLVWQGRTDLRGDPGERTATRVAFQDLSGDGLPEIVVGVRFEPVRLCGVDEPPLLYRRVWDPATGRLRTVTARRAGLQSAEKELRGAAGAAAGEPVPLIPVLTPAGVSSSAGDGGDPLMPGPPGALVDRDPDTAWIPGLGNGAGEFATFAAAAGTFGLTRVGLVLLPEKRKAARWGRPVSLLLAAEDRVYRLLFPGKAAGGVPIWFDLPEPLSTECISLVLEAVEGGGGRPPAISEVVVFSEVDSPEGLELLAGKLDDDGDASAALELLSRAGTPALGAIDEVWDDLGLAGRRRAVRAIPELTRSDPGTNTASTERAAALLAEAALSDDEILSSAAEAGLGRMGPALVAPLSVALEDEDDRRFERAARLLAGSGQPESVSALAAAVGAGGPRRRGLLRDLLAGAAAAPDRTGLLLDLLEHARESGERERLIDLARVAVRVAAADERLAAVALPAYEEAGGFADRYRLLEVVAGLGDDRSVPLLMAAAGDDDHLIRAAAITGLQPRAVTEEARDASRAALEDAAPEVRLAALGALAGVPLSGEVVGAISRTAAADPWPEVRGAAVALSPFLPEEAAAALVAAALADRSWMVRNVALSVAGRLPATKEVDQGIIALLEDESEFVRLRSRAAVAAGLRCQSSAVAPLRSLLARGAEPLAPPEWIEAARSAAAALGAIGGESARAALELVRRRSNPAAARAIDHALERTGEGCTPGRMPLSPEGAAPAGVRGDPP